MLPRPLLLFREGALWVSIQVLLESLGEWDVDDTAIVRGQLVPTRGVNAAPITFESVTG